MLLVAPLIGTHPGAQRFHTYANDVGLFVHVPVDTANVWPCTAVPEITGAAVFTGGGGTSWVTVRLSRLMYRFEPAVESNHTFSVCAPADKRLIQASTSSKYSNSAVAANA